MPSANDPRDSITPGDKEWEEFRASLAAAMLLAWFLSDLDLVTPDYFTDLDRRFQDGFASADALPADDPAHEVVSIQGPNTGGEFFDHDFADELSDLLFPHREAEGGVLFIPWCLTVVAIQSALE